MANISITGGTLVSDIPVEKERKEVVETIATVNESNVSVKRGTLVMKRVGEMVDVIQGGIQAMQQPPQDEKAPFDPDRQFYQSFREDVTPPTEVQTTQLSGMAAPQAGQAATSPQPISSPEFKTTESPTISKPDVEDSPDVDTTAPRRLQSSSKKDLLEFIGQGEGTYNSLNRGTINGNIIGAEREGSRDGKKISELTISEIRNYQKIKDPNNPERLFTVGKYQTRPSTFEQAVKGLQLSDDTVFSPEVQDSIGVYLIGQKREDLGKFLEGDESVSVDRAMFMLALEFASMPVPFDIKKGTYAEGTLPKVDLVAGDSFYKDPKAEQGNRALKTVKETRDILLKTRDSSQ